MISFILPIKNRFENLEKILSNCKAVFKKLKYEIVIIDASNTEIARKNKVLVNNFKNIKYFKQKSTRITRGCFEALKHLKYDNVTFLYDDDVMGPYVYQIYKNFVKSGIFSMGTGIVLEQDNTKYKFKKIKKFRISKKNLLINYYGQPLSKIDTRFNNFISSPASPICTCFKKKYLYDWKDKIFRFTKNNNFRNHYLLVKDIGPDLIAYLTNIINSEKKIYYYLPPSVRFSSHDESISIIYGKNNLRIGYWLARISILENEKIRDKEVLKKIYTYLFFIGFCLFFINIFNSYNRRNILRELLILKSDKKFIFSFNYLLKILKILIFK